MDFKKITKKIIPNLIVFSLLISSSIYFLLIFHYLRPNYNMIYLSYEEKMVNSYEEKMELIGEVKINPYKVFNFINNHISYFCFNNINYISTINSSYSYSISSIRKIYNF